jgi:hypothetical protein
VTTVTVTATARAMDCRVGTVAVLLAGQENDEAVVATAVSIAAECGARISILAVPRRVPVGAHCLPPMGHTIPFNAVTLRAEALVDAATAGKRAADFVPAGIPADYVVIPGSPVRAMEALADRKPVAYIVVDESLLVRRPRLRWASVRWARAGTLLKVV